MVSKVAPGDVYYNLTVISLDRVDERSRRFWKCQCSCGSEVIVQASLLTSGSTKGCGCYRSAAAESRRLPNNHREVSQIIAGYKRHATRRGLSWNLERSDVDKIVRMPCYYCGLESSNIMKTKNTVIPFAYNGIDRVDNSLGYSIENCVPCCKQCNWSKRDMTSTEFIEWASRVAAKWG